MRAGSRISGWFVVITTIRSGVSTTPSSTLSSPDRLSLSFLRPLKADEPEAIVVMPPAASPIEGARPASIMDIIIAIFMSIAPGEI